MYSSFFGGAYVTPDNFSRLLYYSRIHNAVASDLQKYVWNNRSLTGIADPNIMASAIYLPLFGICEVLSIHALGTLEIML